MCAWGVCGGVAGSASAGSVGRLLDPRLGGLWGGCWIRVWGVCGRGAVLASAGSIAHGERRSGSVFRLSARLIAFVVAGRLPPSPRRPHRRDDTAALSPTGSLGFSWPVGGGSPPEPTSTTLGDTRTSLAPC